MGRRRLRLRGRVRASGHAFRLDGRCAGLPEPHAAHEFHWATSEVISTLLDTGLIVEHFREYDYCNGFRPYTEMKDLGGRRWTVPDGKPSLPFMYSVVARKPA